MKKLFLETGGEVSNTAHCNPFKMRLHLQGILGDEYSSELYHEALQRIVKHRLARFGGMYLTERGANYVERLMIMERSGYVITKELLRSGLLPE